MTSTAPRVARLKAGTRSCLGSSALLFFGTLLAFGVAEVSLRVLARYQRGGKEQVERNAYTEYDPAVGWRKRPGAFVKYERRDYRSAFRINELGLRGPMRPYTKPAGTLRVLALGDSFVEAFMVPDNETVTARLEEALKPGLPCSIEVLNGGTVGYSTDQEYLFYRDQGRRYSPDVVLLFTYHNDIPYLTQERYFAFPKPRLGFEGPSPRIMNEPVPPYVPTPAPAATPEALRGSHLVEFVKDRIERRSARTYNRLASWGLWEPLRTTAPGDELNLYHVPPYGHLNAAWSAYTWTVESLNRLVRAGGATLVVAYIPSRMEVNDADYEVSEARYGLAEGAFDRAAVAKRIRAVTQRLGIPFLDLTGALREQATFLHPVYFATDSHWNARGQNAAANAAASFLRTERLMSCPQP